MNAPVPREWLAGVRAFTDPLTSITKDDKTTASPPVLQAGSACDGVTHTHTAQKPLWSAPNEETPAELTSCTQEQHLRGIIFVE